MSDVTTPSSRPEAELLNQAQRRECVIRAVNGGVEYIAPIHHVIPDTCVLLSGDGFDRFIDWAAAERRLRAATATELVGLDAIPRGDGDA